jgi:hypothetical protein
VDFDPAIRRFESCHPSYFKRIKKFNNEKVVFNLQNLHN